MADRDVVLVFNVCSANVDYTVQKTGNQFSWLSLACAQVLDDEQADNNKRANSQ